MVAIFSKQLHVLNKSHHYNCHIKLQDLTVNAVTAVHISQVEKIKRNIQ
jgi:hypothetical protein